MKTTLRPASTLCRAALCVGSLLASASLASAALIDTFSAGSIVNTSAPPTQFFDQSAVAGVIGTGDRNLFWLRAAGPGTADLDLNTLVPGNALLSSGAATSGMWQFIYGDDTAFNVDMTDGGLSNAFVVYFAAADVGIFSITAIDTGADSDTRSVAIPSLPLGGFVAIPFALYNFAVDFNHIAFLNLTIEGSAGGDYEMQILNTQFVPEPASAGLLGLGLAGLVFAKLRRRGASCG